jgi:hypothetical protein
MRLLPVPYERSNGELRRAGAKRALAIEPTSKALRADVDDPRCLRPPVCSTAEID